MSKKDLKYNEYMRMTRDRLKNYNKLCAAVANLKDTIKIKEQLIALDVAAPISKYGDEPGGGSGELNVVEAAANRHMETRCEIADMQKRLACLELAIRKIDRAVDALSDEDRTLIRGYYFDEQDWNTLADNLGHSYSWAASRGARALRKVAGILFADKVTPEQLTLDIAFV